MSLSLETLRILDQLGALEFEKTSGNDQNMKGNVCVTENPCDGPRDSYAS